VQTAGVANFSRHNDAFTRLRRVRVINQNVERLFLGSMSWASQVPVARWHELIGDPTIGDAILDRVIHCAHRVELKGPSLRKRNALVAASAESANPVSAE
jgi:DNA replication protein DnaC